MLPLKKLLSKSYWTMRGEEGSVKTCAVSHPALWLLAAFSTGPPLQEQPGQAAPDQVRQEEHLQLYLAQRDVGQVLPDLAAALPTAPPFPGVSERLHQRSIWLGCRGTQTPLHRDPYHNLFCQASSQIIECCLLICA